ncbi:MAG: hypothetical protein M3R41_00880 [Pseudomonadota bacterium]|nr:hypothetical protein [Pseudomonadota bacterium]
MTIFVVLMQAPQANVVAEIEKHFAGNFMKLTETQYLVSSPGTTAEMSAKLGVFDADKPASPSTGNAIIFATSSYFGRAPANVWEWMKAKLEASRNG